LPGTPLTPADVHAQRATTRADGIASIFSIGNNSVFLDPITKTQLATGDPKELRDHSPNFVVRNFLMRGTAEPVE